MGEGGKARREHLLGAEFNRFWSEEVDIVTVSEAMLSLR